MSGNRSSKNIPQIYLFWYMSLPFPHRTQSHPSFVLMKYMYNLACLHAQRYHYFQIFFFFPSNPSISRVQSVNDLHELDIQVN